eukprot:737250-Alexandrium_andersonii.AAC.1
MHGRRLQLPRLAAGQPGPEAILSLRRVHSPRLRAVTPGRTRPSARPVGGGLVGPELEQPRPRPGIQCRPPRV